ncbi:MAG: monovalent cation/H(+) antiporter subunit G [Candidatus Limnocylindria bacterium]
MDLTPIGVVSGALLLGGSLAVLAGGIGVLRLPDVYTRLHAAGVTDTLGALLLLSGLALLAGWSLVTVKLLLILLLLWLTSPVSSHALARAALAGKIEPRLAPARPSGTGAVE